MKKLVLFLIVLSFVACKKDKDSEIKGNYIDLGLTSGTLWKSENEHNPDDAHGFYTYNEARNKFKNQVPTKEQLSELIRECTWTWVETGYKVSGPNGKSIVLPAEGFCTKRDRELEDANEIGMYWSSTMDTYSQGDKDAFHLKFNQRGTELTWDGWGLDACYSVRLVKKP